MMILQANETFRRAIGVLKLANLLAVETDGNRRSVGFNFKGMPLTDGGSRRGAGEFI